MHNVKNARAYHTGNGTKQEVGISAPDKRTIVVRLVRPEEQWEATTSLWPFFPIRQDLIEKHGASSWSAGIIPSSGPYMVVSYEPGKKLSLKKNLYYTNSKSNIDSIEIDFSTDFDEAVKKYKQGYYYFLSPIPISKINELASNSDFKSKPIYRNYTLVANASKYPMSNTDFRKALLESIRLDHIKPELNRWFKKAKGMAPDALAHYTHDLNLYDSEKARASLIKSGVFLKPNLKIQILTRIQDPFPVFAEMVKSQIEKNLGIQVEVSARHQSEFNAYAASADYDFCLVSWSAKIIDWKDFLLPYSGISTNSRLIFKDPTFDQSLLDSIGNTSNVLKRQSLLEAENKYLDEKAVFLPLYDETIGYLVSPKIRGFYVNYIGVPSLRNAIIP